MKAKLNLAIEEDLIPLSKKFAKEQGMSVSELVEKLLGQVIDRETPPFSTRWRGRFRAAEKSEPRYEKLKARFLT